MVVPLLALAAAGLTAAFLAPEVASRVQEFKETPEIRQQLQRAQVRRSIQSGSRAVDDANPNDLLYQASGFIPGIGALDRRRQESFVYAAQADLMQQGYAKKEALRIANAAYRDYAARSISEVPVALTGEATAELIGRRVLTRVLPRTISQQAARGVLNPVARAGIKSSAVAGAYEGALAVTAEDVARRRFGETQKTVLPLGLKEGSPEARAAAQAERIAAGGAFGSIFAGAFGAVIAGQRIPRKQLSRATEVLGYSIDPGELPGDIIASRVAKRYREPDVPSIRIIDGIPVPVRSKSSRGLGVGAAIQSFFKGPSAEGFVGDNASQQLIEIEKTLRRQQGGVNFPGAPVPGFSGTPSDVPGDVPTDDKTSVPGDTIQGGKSFASSGAKSESQQQQSSTAVSMIPADVSIPATSTIYRGGSPPLPFLPQDEEDFGRRGGPSSQRYINELRRGGKLLKRLL